MNNTIKQLMIQADYVAPDIAKRAQRLVEITAQDCANWIREHYDHPHAEGIAWNLEIHYGLHGDYA